MNRRGFLGKFLAVAAAVATGAVWEPKPTFRRVRVTFVTGLAASSPVYQINWDDLRAWASREAEKSILSKLDPK